MKGLLRGGLIAALLFLAPTPTWAQGSILQSGPVTPGHSFQWVQSGIAMDAGPASGGQVGQGISELLLTARGTGTPPYVAQGSGPFGTNFCDYDAPVTNPTGYHYLCWSANAQGGALIATGAGGIATPQGLNIIINGQTYPFPGSGAGNVVGPASSTVGHVAIFNNAFGTLLADGGVFSQRAVPEYYVDTAGSDTNDCLAAISGGGHGPCLTIQHVIGVIEAADYGNIRPDVNVACGTYSGGIAVYGNGRGQQSGQVLPASSIRVIGTGGSACTFLTLSNTWPLANAGAVTVSNAGFLTLSGLTISNTTFSGSTDLFVQNNGYIAVSTDMNFGAATNAHMHAESGGVIEISAPYTISGNANDHWTVAEGSTIKTDQDAALDRTLTCTAGFTAVANEFILSIKNGNGAMTYNMVGCGGVTGRRWTTKSGGAVTVTSNDLTYLPGDSQGITDGGVYRIDGSPTLPVDGFGSGNAGTQGYYLSAVRQATWTSNQLALLGTASSTGYVLRLENLEAPGVINHNPGFIQFLANDSASALQVYAQILATESTVTAGLTDGLVVIQANKAGVNTTIAQFDGKNARVNLTPGICLAFNAACGTAGQIAVSAGAATVPTWSSTINVTSIGATTPGTGAFTTMDLSAAAPTVAAAHIGYGSTTAAAANCNGGGGTPAACIVVNVAGTTRYVPYF